MKGIEARETFFKDLRVRETEMRPTFEDKSETRAFRALEFSGFNVGVVNHLPDA